MQQSVEEYEYTTEYTEIMRMWVYISVLYNVKLYMWVY